MTKVDCVKGIGCEVLDSRYGKDGWVYIGRGGHYGGRELRRSALGNPYRVRTSRGETIQRYRTWLWKRITAGDREVVEALVHVNQVGAVVCHCPQPGPCHGHVVVAAAEWLMSEAGEKYRLGLA